jgi:hypothetical protein
MYTPIWQLCTWKIQKGWISMWHQSSFVEYEILHIQWWNLELKLWCSNLSNSDHQNLQNKLDLNQKLFQPRALIFNLMDYIYIFWLRGLFQPHQMANGQFKYFVLACEWVPIHVFLLSIGLQPLFSFISPKP